MKLAAQIVSDNMTESGSTGKTTYWPWQSSMLNCYYCVFLLLYMFATFWLAMWSQTQKQQVASRLAILMLASLGCKACLTVWEDWLASRLMLATTQTPVLIGSDADLSQSQLSSPSLPVPMSWSSIARICAWADIFLSVQLTLCESLLASFGPHTCSLLDCRPRRLHHHHDNRGQLLPQGEQARLPPSQRADCVSR